MKIPQTFILETKSDKKLEDLLEKSSRKKIAKSKGPRVGMRMYVPDFVGYICKIKKINKTINNYGEEEIYVSFEGHPFLWCEWNYLQENQAEWKEYDNKASPEKYIN